MYKTIRLKFYFGFPLYAAVGGDVQLFTWQPFQNYENDE